MTRAPDVLVLPAFSAADYDPAGVGTPGDAGVAAAEGSDAPDELGRWLDAYDAREVAVSGTGGPVYYDDAGVAIAPTGIGKAAAAATVGALAAGDALDLGAAHVVTAGVAGCPPAAGPVGSVFVADAVVDWDLKHRTDGGVGPLDWRARDYVWHLDADLVERAAAAAERADLRAAGVDDREPGVAVGPTLCGDEHWHGRRLAAQAATLCGAYGLDGYVTAEMEDAGTATALERAGLLDRYVSVRAAANFDRQPPGGDPAESVREMALDVATGNAFRAGREVVEALAGGSSP